MPRRDDYLWLCRSFDLRWITAAILICAGCMPTLPFQNKKRLVSEFNSTTLSFNTSSLTAMWCAIRPAKHLSMARRSTTASTLDQLFRSLNLIFSEHGNVALSP